MGVRQQFKMDKFDWCVTVYYTVDDDQKMEIFGELMRLECDKNTVDSIVKNLSDAKVDSGFTYSSFKHKSSIVVIHKASSIGEFINTFEHEKNHLEMHICEALEINPYSEEAAHMSGDLAQMFLEKAFNSIAEL